MTNGSVQLSVVIVNQSKVSAAIDNDDDDKPVDHMLTLTLFSYQMISHVQSYPICSQLNSSCCYSRIYSNLLLQIQIIIVCYKRSVS